MLFGAPASREISRRRGEVGLGHQPEEADRSPAASTSTSRGQRRHPADAAMLRIVSRIYDNGCTEQGKGRLGSRGGCRLDCRSR